MLDFDNWLKNNINEKLITFGGRAYPKFGNVVILAGGTGSGKDFQLEELLGIEGRIFDVDHLKTLALSTPKILKEITERMDLTPEEIDLKNPEHVKMIHDIISTVMRLPEKRDVALAKSLPIIDDILLKKHDKKPNLIFNVTLKNLNKLWDIGMYTKKMGYESHNIHIVWIINDIELAKIQNLERERVVPTEILINTHEGVSTTMADILNMGNNIKKFMDGDIWFSFNKRGVNTNLQTSKFGGQWLKDADYFRVKSAGKHQISISELDPKVKNMISSYVPKAVSDRWKQ